MSKKKHAGHHAFCKNDTRLTFALAIPTSESPEFQTSASKVYPNVFIYYLLLLLTLLLVKLQYYLKLEFITADQPSFNLETTKEHTNSASYEQIQASNFDCQIPIHIFGPSSGSSNLSGPHSFIVQ